MKKAQLIQLVKQYQTDIMFRLQGKNQRVVLLKAFLLSPAIAALPDSDEIAFASFESYLKKQHIDPNTLFSPTYFRSAIRSVSIFIKFKYGFMDADLQQAIKKLPVEKIPPLAMTSPLVGKLTEELRHKFYNRYLTDQELGRLMQTASFFNQDVNQIWIERLIQLGVNPAILNELRDNKIINSFKTLYINIKRFYHPVVKLLDVNLTRLLCFSGELSAIRYGLLEGVFTKDDQGSSIAILSLAYAGQVDGMKLLQRELNLDLTQCRFNGANILHYAAMGNSVEAMQFALEQKIPADCVTENGRNALMLACGCGAEDAAKFALNVLKLPRVLEKLKNNELHYACERQNRKGVRLATKLLNISPTSLTGPEWSYSNAMAIAVGTGSVEFIKFVQQELSLSFNFKNSSGASLLHYAAFDGTQEMMEFLVGSVGLDPRQVDKFGRNILHPAALGGNATVIHYIVFALSIDLYQETKIGSTPMWFAIDKQSSAVILALRQAGYDVSARDSKGRTSFDILNNRNFPPEVRATLYDALTQPVVAQVHTTPRLKPI